jgi:catechol 2,3-dioxygenase-like lactoylglutathione lyase family enzyme
MKITALMCGLILPGLLQSQSDALPAPHFHHLHLNSINPDAAIGFYTRQFPSTTKSNFAGLPALKAGNVYLLFNKVAAPPPTEPQTALWHFGWHVVDVHKSYEIYRERKEVHLLPLYTTGEGGFVYVSSDTWPGANGSLGRTQSEIADAKAKGVQPTHGAGFAYLEGPDGAIIEYQGNMPAERFNHVHMYQKDPFCAELWYQQHLNARVNQGRGRPVYTEANCKMAPPERSWPALEREGMLRMPAGVAFDDVTVQWHIQQDEKPLVSSLGHVSDHVGLSVSDLDAWVAKLRREGVKFLNEPYKLGEMRAVMIEGPSREALELVGVR